MPKLLSIFLLLQFIFLKPCFSASESFYTLADKWERSTAAGTNKKESIEKSFTSALTKAQEQNIQPAFPPAPVIERTFLQIEQSGNSVEIELNQSLVVHSGADITKFISTDEGIVILETIKPDTLRVLGSGIGPTFVHVWESGNRHTFQVQVLPQKFRPTQEQINKLEEFQKSRTFKFGYNNSRSAFYTGPKFRDKSRTSVDFTQGFSLEGDTPYGAFSSQAETQKAVGKTLLTDAQATLKDGRVGPLKNFNATLGDSQVAPALMALPGARVRGAELEHWDDAKRVVWSGFHGREESSIIGTLTPGIVSKRTLNSYLSGGVLDFKVNDQAKIHAGLFSASGKSRADNLNRLGEGIKGDIDLGPHVKFSPELSFDNERWAEKHAVVAKFEKLRIRDEYRNINKGFVTLIGAPSRQGELGNLLDVSADPFDNVSFTGSLDIFNDRLVPNPEDLGSRNIHTDLSLSIRPAETSNLLFNFQDIDDTGRIGPSRQRTLGGQFNQSFNFLGHHATFFSRYQNSGNRNLTNSTSDYVRDRFTFGMHTEIFWGIQFSIEKEWSRLKEPNINRLTRPNALTYSWDYSHQIGDTPFYMDARLRIRDEEDTESVNSFMAGEDSTEISGAIYYREYENMEIYLTGSFENFVPESLNVASPRIEAQFLTGMRYIFDTGARWSPVGSFRGFVFKDANSDGVRQPDEPGIKDMLVKSSDGKQAVTDANGFYELKSVSGQKATISLDNSKIPYGYAPTTPVNKESVIEQNQTQEIDFGIVPRSEITGIIFNDLNGNGKFESGKDAGVRKVKVKLENGAIARSNTLGAYSFPDVAAGEHTASLDLVSLPEGYLPVGAPKKTFTVYEGIRFELNFPLRAIHTVTGRVFADDNGNKVLNTGEKPISNVKVLLAGQEVLSDKDGWYLFENLNPGSHELVIDPASLPEGFEAPLGVKIEIPVEPITVSDKDIPLTVKKAVETPTEELQATSPTE